MNMSTTDESPVTPPRTTPTKMHPSMTVTSDDTPPTTPPSLIGSPPRLERSFSSSTVSSNSTVSSGRSSLARGELMVRRRGFMRPQGTEFSTSARSRDSVMALGSIAHLQYFFAKTGLLDGKGGGLKTKKSASDMFDTTIIRDSTYSSLRSSPEMLLPHEQEFFAESPSETIDDFIFDESIMLPPTTSTYNPQTKSLPPTPDPEVLRTQLKAALAFTKRAWQQSTQVAEDSPKKSKNEKKLPPLPPGCYELQGQELADLATSAVRAAKAYYYTTDISVLSSKDEKTLREEFLTVLDVLKRMSQRQFEGGVKIEEQNEVVKWIKSVEYSLEEEEAAIADLRSKGREWLEGDWTGAHQDRNRLFLSYFDASTEPLPPYTPITPATPLPTPFLSALRSGLRLILIHNAIVRRSKRPFGQIPSYHTEFSKPYRLAENLRYWKKAAEIRWECKLTFDVMAIVHGDGTEEGWKAFERDIGIWCARVLAEVQADWKMGVGAAVVGVDLTRSRAGSLVSEAGGRSGRSGTLESLQVNLGGDRT